MKGSKRRTRFTYHGHRVCVRDSRLGLKATIWGGSLNGFAVEAPDEETLCESIAIVVAMAASTPVRAPTAP